MQEQTGTLRKMVLGLGVLVMMGAGAAYWLGHRSAAQAQARVDELLKRNDSLSAMFEKTVGSMKGRVAGLDSALAGSKKESDQIRSRIHDEMEKGSDAKVEDLSARLDLAERRQRALVSAGNVDYESIAAKDGPAIVFIAVEEAGGELMSGSGFNVSPSGLVITNRHVVQDAQGRPAKRVKVIFDNMRGAWKSAHVLKVSTTDELAFIKIDDAGSYPVVAGVAKRSGVRVGTPVALMGYPLGTSTAGMGGNINTLLPKFSLGLGTVSKSLTDTLQFDAYAAPGSSGSAVFDSRGFVVGVLFGGQAESNGRIVYAVPSEKLADQMPPEGKRDRSLSARQPLFAAAEFDHATLFVHCDPRAITRAAAACIGRSPPHAHSTFGAAGNCAAWRGCEKSTTSDSRFCSCAIADARSIRSRLACENPPASFPATASANAVMSTGTRVPAERGSTTLASISSARSDSAKWARTGTGHGPRMSSSTCTISTALPTRGIAPRSRCTLASATCRDQISSSSEGSRPAPGRAHDAQRSRRSNASRNRSSLSSPRCAARSSARASPLGSVGASSMSHPATSARAATSTSVPTARIPRISSASLTTRPSNSIVPRSSEVRIGAESVAGTLEESSAGYATCAVITEATPASIAERKGARSSCSSQ